MGKNIAALRVGSKIVTGVHHGEAFAKLTDEEKGSELLQSGFIDPEQTKFFTEDQEVQLKEFIILRHADSEGKWDSTITKIGRSQIAKAAAFLFYNFDLSAYQIFSSPYRRCWETASELCNTIKKKFGIHQALAKRATTESPLEFNSRIKNLFNYFPASKSIIISHADVVEAFSRFTGWTNYTAVGNCSVTYINNCHTVWYARNCENFDCSM